MAASWAEKYRPKTLKEIAGNPHAVEMLRRWGESWREGTPERRAVLLHGSPGSGKTSAAHALAHDLGWGLVELNASDVRSGPAIRRIAGSGAAHETFSDTGDYFASAQGRRKLIVLDEADNLYERPGDEGRVGDADFSDRGGKRAILETIAATRQPIVLIANDPYPLTKGGGAFQKLVLSIQFRGLTAAALQKLLASVAQAEGVQVNEPVLRDLASRAQGDARSALNDLQALAEGRTDLRDANTAFVGQRNRPTSLFDALSAIFKGENAEEARRALLDLDEPPDFVLAWLDENVPREYREPSDLAGAYEWLSRADVFLGRVRRRQHYGLWGTARSLLAVGVSSAKTRRYGTPPYYQFPSWIRKMSSSKGDRELRRGVASKVAQDLHVGFRPARADMIPFLRSMSLRDPGFAEHAALRFGLDEDELRYLLGPQAKESYVEQVLERVESHRRTAPAQTEVAAAEPAEDAPEPEARAPSATPGRTLFDF